MAQELPEIVNGLPNISGSEELIAEAMKRETPVYEPESDVDFGHVRSTFAVALHMHQPLIPAGADDLQHAPVVSNLQYMMEHPDIGDNHNASVFRWCYQRLAEFIPQLVRAGRQPRVMLEYSGCLLYGLRAMGAGDVLEQLRALATEPQLRRHVEWLGAPWGHAVAPSTPVQDYRLHVQAWQHHFAAIFGLEALSRVRGFSPSEMALPNHPDVFFEFVKTLKDCGYKWVMVQEHSVEKSRAGGAIGFPHLPHRLLATNSRGETIGITAVIKTQGSDTKLVAQMQPYYEAKGLDRGELAGVSLPPLVTQIADGENGGVMMNEFPGKFMEVMSESSHSQTRAVNVTEYLEHLARSGVKEEDLPAIQPIMQNRIWERFQEGAGPEKLEQVIAQLEKEDDRFHMEGGSWTNNISWVKGYDHVLQPMEEVSATFAQKVLDRNIPTSEHRYRNALFYLLTSQTSCYRYWGEGIWTDYGRELCRRGLEIMKHDF